jgi:hypothetical protein
MRYGPLRRFGCALRATAQRWLCAMDQSAESTYVLCLRAESLTMVQIHTTSFEIWRHLVKGMVSKGGQIAILVRWSAAQRTTEM